MHYFLYFVLIGIAYAAENNTLIFSTTECFLIEPVYDYKFDFTPLNTDFAHIAFSNVGDQFDFNICGNLHKTCDGKQNVSACLTKDNKEYVLGTKQELNYQNGKMFFSYTNGSKCPYSTSGENFQLHVVVGCDYSLDKNQSQVTPYSKNACSFYLTLETPHACLPEPADVASNSCTVKDPETGHIYDLFSLSDMNYRTTDRQGSAFIINICKPVLYGENAMCPAGSSVCFVSLKASNIKYRFSDYGTAQSNPVIENGHLLMKMPSQTRCNKTNYFTSIIHFYCDMGVKNAHPELIGLDNCVYEFSFATPLACSNLAPCTAVTHGNEINAPCQKSNGVATSAVAITTTTSSWSTKIEFVCANNATKNYNSKLLSLESTTGSLATGPKIIENTKCQLLIHYQTELACHEQITCKAKVYTDDGTGVESVDLTPLISATENYEARVDASLIEKNIVGKTTKFFLNICRPLLPEFGLGCPGGSAACMATIDASSPTPEAEKSMGYPLASLVAINRTTAELRYLGGGICPTDKKTQISTGITFYCDMRAGRGTPVLRAINDCHYEFEWATNVICPPHMCIFDEKTCEIVNDDINVRFNFKNALFTDQGKIKVSIADTELDINVCGNHRKAVTDYSQHLVNLYFTTTGMCKSTGLVNVQMRLVCSSKTGIASTFTDESQCNLVYVLHTPDICGFLGLTLPTVSPTTSSSVPIQTIPTELSTIDTADQNKQHAHTAEHVAKIGGLLAVILTLVLFTGCLTIVLYSPERRQIIRSFFQRTTSAVRSNEEANLLLDPNGEFSDSDDDMLL